MLASSYSMNLIRFMFKGDVRKSDCKTVKVLDKPHAKIIFGNLYVTIGASGVFDYVQHNMST